MFVWAGKCCDHFGGRVLRQFDKRSLLTIIETIPCQDQRSLTTLHHQRPPRLPGGLDKSLRQRREGLPYSFDDPGRYAEAWREGERRTGSFTATSMVQRVRLADDRVEKCHAAICARCEYASIVADYLFVYVVWNPDEPNMDSTSIAQTRQL